MRLLIEGYMDIIMATCLQLKHYNWDGDIAVNVTSHIAAIFFLVTGVVMPIGLIIYFACNISKWNKKAFAERNGALLEGVDLERKEIRWIVLLVPVFFFLRRLLMGLTLIFWSDFLWGQICIQFFLSTALVIILGWFRPLDSSFTNNMEILNEMTTLCILYMIMCFSDFV